MSRDNTDLNMKISYQCAEKSQNRFLQSGEACHSGTTMTSITHVLLHAVGDVKVWHVGEGHDETRDIDPALRPHVACARKGVNVITSALSLCFEWFP